MSNLNLFIVLYKSTFSIKMRREDIQDRPIVNVYFCSHPEPPLITVKNVRHIILCLCTKTREQDNTPLAAHDRRESDGSKSCVQLPQRFCMYV